MKNIETIRHSLAHFMASAIKEFWPQAQLAIGPAIDNGFYYDIDFGDDKLTEADLAKIEKRMAELISQKLSFTQEMVEIKQAFKQAQADGNPYKLEIIADLMKAGDSEVSFYTVGNFRDLCRGPHVKSSAEIKPGSYKLDRLAGAYWRGDEKNKMLTRIYGLAFSDKKELANYLKQREEALARDHRVLAKELDLFHIDQKVGLGLPLFHPKGALLWRLIEDFWYQEHLKNGYQLVRSPHIGSRALWETSGHWGFYNSSMYPPLEAGQTLAEKQKNEAVKESEEYLLKPMNCPFHVQIYKNKLKSYREFPLRWTECGTVYRYEKKGELSGLTRVRGFTQDDAHIFCRADQVESELKRVIDFILFIFQSFGFDTKLINVYLSLRDPNNKEKYAGDDAGWDFTENILRKVAQEKKLNFIEEEGEAAFYGPKLDFKLKDVLNREWQCSTLQFDFNLPERFDISFTNSQGQAERPYILHRALFGSFERFLALLIEHYAGAFPLWIAPVQVKIIPISEKQLDYSQAVRDALLAQGIRVELDSDNETLGNRIRKGVAEKIPYLVVIGDQEVESKELSIRDRGERKNRQLKLNDFITELQARIKEKK